MQEYDLELNPAKLVKGQGLRNLAVEALDPQSEEEEGWDNEVDSLQNEVLYILASTNLWCNDLKYYLTHESSPNNLYAQKKRSLRLKSSQYPLIDDVLFQSKL